MMVICNTIEEVNRYLDETLRAIEAVEGRVSYHKDTTNTPVPLKRRKKPTHQISMVL